MVLKYIVNRFYKDYSKIYFFFYLKYNVINDLMIIFNCDCNYNFCLYMNIIYI